jgi:dsDNA-specific endonuclease/ATPase MutS2
MWSERQYANGIIVMKTKTPIKVIKRDERNRPKPVAEEVKAERKSAQEAARDMVATVSQWVNEFQQKRRAETAQAFKTLLNDPTPQPGKA